MKAEEVLALVGGHVDDELLLRNEYLAAENEILRSKLPARVPMTDDERIRLAKLGKRLGKNALMDVAAIVTPETILSWYWRLVAKKYDGSANRGKIGWPRIDETLEKLILQIAVENRTWGRYLSIEADIRGAVQSRIRSERRDRSQRASTKWGCSVWWAQANAHLGRVH